MFCLHFRLCDFWQGAEFLGVSVVLPAESFSRCSSVHCVLSVQESALVPPTRLLCWASAGLRPGRIQSLASRAQADWVTVLLSEGLA